MAKNRTHKAGRIKGFKDFTTAFTDDTTVTKSCGKAIAKRCITSVAAKVPNYTPEQVQDMVTKYNASPTESTVSALATQLGKSVKSVVARLVREKNPDGSKVYHAKAYKAKDGTAPVKKETLCDELQKLVPSLTANEVDAFTKATKTGLLKVVKALQDGEKWREAYILGDGADEDIPGTDEE